MDLKFKQSNIGCYKVVEFDNRKFVMDLSTLKSKSYYWGLLPKTVSLKLSEIDKNNNKFEINNRKVSLSTTVIAIIVQPFVKIGYDLLKSFFINYDLSSQIIIKTVLFFVSIVISYLIVAQSLFRAHAKSKMFLDKNFNHYQITFNTSKKRNPVNLIVLIGNLICFCVYMYVNNGTEGAILVINCVWSIVLFLSSWTMPPISHSYQNQFLTFEGIEKVIKIKESR
ncbi:DUF443 domain-containing protein [Streptococcus pluranimalium]|nr:hypothetical protein [Streptococcus pluranimalium]